MKTGSIILDKDYKISEIDENLYGSFIEHLGRAVYTGIYEPDHPQADEMGFRKDVLELVKDLSIPVVRYPGGNFVSGYNWTDGIGPKEERPIKLDYAWLSKESNQVGIDEFASWCKKANTSMMAAVNLGTGTPQEAGNMVEYCNFSEGTMWSDLRIKYGNKNPHDIKIWCLGNEMDGPWQTCALTAEDYGKKAKEAAKIMKWVDSSIELVACGSSSPFMDTYPEWDRVVMEHVYEHADYISLHRYYENEGNVADFLASFVDMDDFIHTIASTADYVKAKKRSSKTLKLSFDEWNVWYQKKQKRFPWEFAPPILEDSYSMLDALVFGGMLCTLINNSDRVKIACLAQLVNVIAPIFTEKGGKALKQTIYYPFQQVSNFARGTAIKTITKCEEIETKYGVSPLIQTAATFNSEENTLTLFILNCDQDSDFEMNLDIRSFGDMVLKEHLFMKENNIFLQNTFDEPEKVIPKKTTLNKEISGKIELQVSSLSWNVFRFEIK